MSARNASTDHVSPLGEMVTTNTHLHRQVNWGLWLQWTVACGAAWTVGMAIFGFVAQVMGDSFVIFVFATGPGGLFGACIGLPLGIAQAVVLRPHGWIREWLIATAGSAAFGGAITRIPLVRMLRQSESTSS